MQQVSLNQSRLQHYCVSSKYTVYMYSRFHLLRLLELEHFGTTFLLNFHKYQRKPYGRD